MRNFLNIIILLGVLQGLISSTLLFLSKRNIRQANVLLGLFILLIALASFNLYAQETSLYGSYSFIRWSLELFPFVMAMPFGPLLYFYSRSLTDPSFRLTRRDGIHFASVVLDLVPPAIVWFFVIGVYTGLVPRESAAGWGDAIDDYNVWVDIPRWVSVSIYLFAARRFLRRHLSAHPDVKTEFYWLHLFLNFVLGFLILWLLFLVPYIIPSLRNQWIDWVGWYPLYVPLTVMVYWAGIRGYIQSRATTLRRPVTSSLSPEVTERASAALLEAMTGSKLYLDPGLSVGQLATLLKIPPKTISAVLNHTLKKSFNEFLNEYRVGEVKRRLLLDRKNGHLTISGIALECGFNSQATFQRAFKSITGLSPTEYLEQENSKISL